MRSRLPSTPASVSRSAWMYGELGQKGFEKSRLRTDKNNLKQSTVYHGLKLVYDGFDD
jgi:hypothetical protein